MNAPRRGRKSRRPRFYVAAGLAIALTIAPLAANGTPALAAPIHHRTVAVPATRSGTATPAKPAAAPAADPAIAAAVAATAARAATGVHQPAGGTAILRTPGPHDATAAATGLPVALAPAAGSTAGALVRVQLADPAIARAAGADGVVVGLSPVSESALAAPRAATTTLSLDYAGAAAGGGDYASRLTLVEMPACALTTPGLAACQPRTPVPFHNDIATATITAQVTVPANPAGIVFATVTTPSSGAGDYSATSLAPTATWQNGGNSGDFTWSYPIRVPPASGGLAPSLSINYDSQSLDGRLPANNNQPSWIGDGFDMPTSYIERQYGSCADDGQTNKYDLCWKYNNATLVLDGQATELIRDDTTGTWRPQNDDGSTVVDSTVSPSINGDNDGETWTVTTTDGTRYVFGLNELPGWASGDAVTNSVWTAPVYGDDAGEPCHASTFATSSCMQAWRWNLDYVVDPNGNTETLWYTPEYNYYAQDGSTTVNGTKYTRGGYLDRIDYGQNSTDIYTSKAPDQVVFTTAERCLVTSSETCTSLTSSDQSDWPDVPFTQICAASTHCTASQVGPTFFSRRRLTDITTQYYTGSAYQKVDSWDLTQAFPATGDGTSPPLWLSSIKHTGDVGTAVGLTSVSFAGIQETNRVDTSDDSIAALIRWRVRTITSETGSVITVNYMAPQCIGGTTMPTPDSNTTRCFPAYWTPPGSTTPRLDWFNKYPISQVLQSDPTTSSPTVETDYTYAGAAWHYDDANGIGKAKNKTWSQWRGYATVTTTVGSSPDVSTQTKSLYYQGMDGDKLAAGGTKSVQVTDSQGTKVTDAEPLAGQPRETITDNGVGGPEVSGQIFDKFIHQTAAQSQSWGTVDADIVRDAAVHYRTDLSTGGVRTQTVSTTYDTSTTPATGLPLTVDDTGDTAVTGDETCTRTTYAQNTTKWLMNYPDRVERVAVGCAGTPSRPAQVITDTRTEYDGGAFGAGPTKGNPTTTERLLSYTGSTPNYQTTTTTTYDAEGRPLVVTDGRGYPTTTAYTPATGGPLTGEQVTDALGHVSTTTVSPAWGEPTATVDANNHRTDLAYDGLGRLISVWLPTRLKSASQNPNLTYVYGLSNSAPSTITTKTLNNDGTTYQTSSVELFDAMLRTRQTQTPAPGGGRVITETDYNSLGQGVDADDDYADASNPSTTFANITSIWPKQTISTYDGDGRVVTSTLKADGAVSGVTSTSYGGDRTTVTPPAGGVATTTITDVFGNVTERDQYNGSTPTGSAVATKYTYTPANKLATITDAAGNRWSYTYDQQQRQIKAVDPDSGTTLTDYDADDNVADTTDAVGSKLVYTYDALDRKTGEYLGSVAAANERAAWVWDTVAKGLLTSSTRYVGGSAGSAYVEAVTSYDAMDRVTGSTVTIPSSEPTGIAGSYPSTAAYNLDGTVAAETVPAGGGLGVEPLTFTYNATRQLTGIEGSTGVVQNALYTKLGQLQQLTLGVSATGKWVQETNAYEDGTERLHNTLVTDDTNAAPDVNATYGYDAAGNTTEINDQGGGTDDNQCFTYDGQARLSQAWTTTSTCPAGPSTGVLGGPAPYWLTWSYDGSTGLRTQQVNHTTTGSATTAYAYPAPASTNPHALQSTTTGSATATYGYNADGETTSRPGTTGQQSLTWTPEGQLATVTEGANVTSDLYDADGNLLISHGPTATTLYVDGEQIARSTTGTLSCQREIDFNGAEVAVRTNAGLTWLVNDPHNTTTVAIDATTQSVSRRYETPFDTARGPAPTAWPDSNGFLDKPYDPVTGLTYIGAREYDADTGRFLSVDPEMDQTDPQSLAAYTYSDNTPIVASDPTGRMFMMDGGGGGGGCNAACREALNAYYARLAAEERAAEAAERAREAAEERLQERLREEREEAMMRRMRLYTGWGLTYAGAAHDSVESVGAGASKMGRMLRSPESTAAERSMAARNLNAIRNNRALKFVSRVGRSDAMEVVGKGMLVAGVAFGLYDHYSEDREKHGRFSAGAEATVQTAADTAIGWGAVAGGTEVGAIIGTAICPVGGTLIGAGIGAVAGTVFAVVSSKVVDNLISKLW